MSEETIDAKIKIGENDNDGDDLDAFFDEVEHVEVVPDNDEIHSVDNDPDAPSTKKVKVSHPNDATSVSTDNNNNINTATDTTTTITSPILPKPVIAKPAQPRGVVVASASAAPIVSSSTTTTATITTNNIASFNHQYANQQQQLFPQQSHSSIPSMTFTTVPATTRTIHTIDGTTTTTTIPPNSNIVDIGTTGTTTTTTTATKPHIRTIAGKVWVDPTLSDWPDNDYRIFVGNLDPTVTDQQLYQHFSIYPSLNQVRIIRDKKKNNTSLGYGFVSLFNPLECAKALREQDQSWLGGRPIRIKRSHWKDRELQEKQKKQKEATMNNKKKNRR